MFDRRASMKTVSVIIPIYNTEEYIEECIQSVLNQTYTRIEIIIVDDNSNDNSILRVKELSDKDERIHIYRFNERKGVGAARNFGVKKAKGDYVYFLDSDDYLPGKTLEYLVSQIGEHNIIRGRMKTTNLASSFAIIYDGTINPKWFIENKYNLIKNNSATNFLIKRSFVKEHKLLFSEEVEIYSDLYFMIPALEAVEYIPYLNEAIYFKRRRNDPILNPALSQYGFEEKFNAFAKMYSQLKRENKQDLHANAFLDNHLLNFYRKDILTAFKNKIHIDKYFETLYESIIQIDSLLLEDYDWILKREVKKIKTGSKQKYKSMNSMHQFLRDLNKSLKSKRKFHIFLYERLFCKFPIKRKLIFFESFGGKKYSDSPKYIYEYLLNNKDGYKYVWSMNEKRKIPGSVKQVKRNSLSYLYYLARSKYWVSNARLPNDVIKRDGITYLQTWHGTPLKKLAADLDNVFMPGTNPSTYKNNFYKETSKWDYLVSPNKYSSEIFQRAFWFNNTLLEYGYPRNDILYKSNNPQDIGQLKEKMNLPKDKKVILYAPTWRDDEYFSVGKYKFSLKLDLNRMQKELGEEYIIILRMHYLIASQLDVSEYNHFVYDFSDYDDISQLYLISDVLITDYSSVFFDYANLKRPILFYMYDLDKYRDQLRGFYLDIEKDLPGPILTETNEIMESIHNLDTVQRNYQQKYDLFYKKFCKWDNGLASKNIVEKIFKSENR